VYCNTALSPDMQMGLQVSLDATNQGESQARFMDLTLDQEDDLFPLSERGTSLLRALRQLLTPRKQVQVQVTRQSDLQPNRRSWLTCVVGEGRGSLQRRADGETRKSQTRFRA